MPADTLSFSDPLVPPPVGDRWPFEAVNEHLAGTGISVSPRSTASEINALSFEFPDLRSAREYWDQIRLPSQRAMVEFLMHEVPVPPADSTPPPKEFWDAFAADEFVGDEDAGSVSQATLYDVGALPLPIDSLLAP